MKVLVTGASGFVGNYLVEALDKAGFEVTGVYRTNIPKILKKSRVGYVRADLGKGVYFIKGPFDAIVHAAASTPLSGVTTDQMIRDNVYSTQELLRAAPRWGTKQFILFSSVSMYGRIDRPVLDESCPIITPTAYGATKYLSEQLLKEQDIPGLALRLPGILGPRAHHGNWLPGVAEKLRKGETVRAFNLDRPFNNAVHVDDIAKLIISNLMKGWKGYDAMVLGADGVMFTKMVIERLAKVLKVKAKIEEIPAAQKSFVISSKHAMSQWGYDPLEIGKMVDQYGAELAYETV